MFSPNFDCTARAFSDRKTHGLCCVRETAIVWLRTAVNSRWRTPRLRRAAGVVRSDEGKILHYVQNAASAGCGIPHPHTQNAPLAWRVFVAFMVLHTLLRFDTDNRKAARDYGAREVHQLDARGNQLRFHPDDQGL